MDIRPAFITDSNAISQLLTVLAKKYIIGELSEEGVNNLLGSMTVTSIQAFFDQGYRYHVGEINHKIVGVVGTRDNSHLFHLFVDEKHQGNGYSSMLWQIGQKACLTAGNPGYFTVNSSLNAQEIYKGWGFVPLGGIREGGGVKDIPMRIEGSKQ
jgi:GNAT superfamily N-acetyltransferase